MILSTTDVIQGAIVEAYLGVVTAEVVYGTNALRDFFAGIRDIIGGRTAGYERVFERGQREALAELQHMKLVAVNLCDPDAELIR